MELMIIIVQEQDYPKLSSTFIHNRVMATKFSTEGLYLNKKNITLMVCIEKEREEEILDYIRQSCTERMEERQVCEYNGMTMVDVTKGVKVGGAIVFFLDVDRRSTLRGCCRVDFFGPLVFLLHSLYNVTKRL